MEEKMRADYEKLKQITENASIRINPKDLGILFDLIKDAELCIFMFGLALLMH